MSKGMLIKVKRDLVVGAAKTTILETEEVATRTTEEVAKLTEKLFHNGARHARATELLRLTDIVNDEEVLMSPESFSAISDHIPER